MVDVGVLEIPRMLVGCLLSKLCFSKHLSLEIIKAEAKALFSWKPFIW